MLLLFFSERTDMIFIHAEYNMYHNSSGINAYAGYILLIDCNAAVDADDSLELW